GIIHNLADLVAEQGDVERAMELWNESLKLLEQIGDVQGSAATRGNMAPVIAQQGDVERAMQLWNESLKLQEQLGDVQGKGATLHNMAGVIAQQGDVDRAMGLWNESLKLSEQIGDVQGKAATLHEMAGVIAEHGDWDRAMELWNESLKLKERIGYVQGKAVTLANMAWAARTKGDRKRERELNLQAAAALAQARAWLDLVTVLGNLGTSDDADGGSFLAQALWLILRVDAPLEHAVTIPAAFVRKVGPEAAAAPLAATYATYLVQTRGKDHPKREELGKGAVNTLGACAEARKVPSEKILEWFKAERLGDPNHFIPRLREELEKLVPEDDWLFDRTLFKSSDS
ncbi:MAG: tetratricopeptide repeat protein, partial [Phycisphaerae bacterium]